MFRSIFTVLLSDRTAVRFIMGAVLGLSFSLCVVLLTIGIMDGFEHTLKKGLQRSVGDVLLYSRKGFFHLDEKLKTVFSTLKVQDYSPLVQTEGLIIHGKRTQGVLVRGVDTESFSQVTGLSLSLNAGEMALGSELMAALQVKKGDMVVVAFVSGGHSTGPLLKQFRVSQVVTHGIYKKDLRLCYLRLEDLQQSLGIHKFNMITMNIPPGHKDKDKEETIELLREDLAGYLGDPFVTAPFWQGFSSLLKAVKVEKFMIALILQLIVIISAVNVLALVIFFNEKKSRELFLFKALGMAQGKIFKIWQLMIVIIWFLACLLSVLWVALFDYALTFFSFLKMPAKIYSLGQFSILLDTFDFALVFFLGLLWPCAVSVVGLSHLKRKPILQGLRREFA